MIHVDLRRFKEFLRNNKDGIIYCMRKSRLSHTNNPFASFENTQRFVRLMRYEDALFEIALNIGPWAYIWEGWMISEHGGLYSGDL